MQYKGVSWDARNKSWRVSISALGKHYWINNYLPNPRGPEADSDTPAEGGDEIIPAQVRAAQQFDAVATAVFGIRSIDDLNFPDEKWPPEPDQAAQRCIDKIRADAHSEYGRQCLIKKVRGKLDKILSKTNVHPEGLLSQREKVDKLLDALCILIAAEDKWLYKTEMILGSSKIADKAGVTDEERVATV